MSNEKKLTARQRYHRAHRDDEEYMTRQREQRVASYYKNVEREREAALARYYKRKEQKILSGKVAEPADVAESPGQ